MLIARRGAKCSEMAFALGANIIVFGLGFFHEVEPRYQRSPVAIAGAAVEQRRQEPPDTRTGIGQNTVQKT